MKKEEIVDVCVRDRGRGPGEWVGLEGGKNGEIFLVGFASEALNRSL